jgi:ABC-type lipoprotein export system ATPase subunit
MLICDNIQKSIGIKSRLFPIIHCANLSIADSEMVAVMGPSGCGKSTLLSILAGLDEPTSGFVKLNGQDIYKLPEVQRDRFRNENIGVIFQSHNLVNELTCLENVAIPMIFARNKNGREDRERIDDLLNWVGLTDKYGLYPYQMSGGEQQRAGIARALLKRPKVLFADEPTGALDQQNSNNIMRLFRESVERDRNAIIVVTHDIDVATKCDRIVRMRDGRIE